MTDITPAPETKTGNELFALTSLNSFSGIVKYKSRIPDPGRCKVLSINFEEERLEVTNGRVRLFPSFGDVEFIGHSKQLEWINKYITEEQLPKEHMEALCYIVGLFNDCEESEKAIFDFAHDLHRQYAS